MKKHMSGLAMAAAMGAAVVSGTGVASASDAPSVSLAAASAAAASSCGAGYVCIYEGDIFDGGTDHPVVYRFYRYGTYNLSGIMVSTRSGTVRPAEPGSRSTRGTTPREACSGISGTTAREACGPT